MDHYDSNSNSNSNSSSSRPRRERERPWWQSCSSADFVRRLEEMDHAELASTLNTISAALASCNRQIDAGIADEDRRRRASGARYHLSERKQLAKAELNRRGISRQREHHEKRERIAARVRVLAKAATDDNCAECLAEALLVIAEYIDPEVDR